MSVFKKIKDVLFDIEDDEDTSVSRETTTKVVKEKNPIKEVKMPVEDNHDDEISSEMSKKNNSFNFPLDFDDDLPSRSDKSSVEPKKNTYNKVNNDLFDDDFDVPRRNRGDYIVKETDYNKKELRSKVGLVFQYPEHQLFEIDVFKDVCFGPKNLGLDRKEVELRAYAALKQVGIEDEYFYQSPFDLSGGQKRRVAIAGVLAMKPEVLILDEPTAGLDPKGRDEILDQIAKLREETGMTVILVSHSMEDVAKYVDRIIVMNKSRVMFDDEPKKVFRHYKELEEVGLAAPQITYIMQTLKAKGLAVDTDITGVEEARDAILKAIRG